MRYSNLSLALTSTSAALLFAGAVLNLADRPVDYQSTANGHVSLGDAYVAAQRMPEGCRGIVRAKDGTGWQLEGCPTDDR